MAIGKIETVILNVKDIDAAVKLYGEMLDIKFEPIEELILPGGVVLKEALARSFGLDLIHQTEPPLVNDNDNVRAVVVRVKGVVKQIVRWGGTHDFFAGEVVSIQADQGVLGANESSVDLKKLKPFALSMGGEGAFEYWGMRERIGKYGYTKGKI